MYSVKDPRTWGRLMPITKQGKNTTVEASQQNHCPRIVMGHVASTAALSIHWELWLLVSRTGTLTGTQKTGEDILR